MQFHQIAYTPIDTYPPGAEHQLVLFYNDDGELDTYKIVKVARRTPSHVVCFYFGPGRVETSGELDRRFTFANARTQLYGNLMNALRYLRLLS